MVGHRNYISCIAFLYDDRIQTGYYFSNILNSLLSLHLTEDKKGTLENPVLDRGLRYRKREMKNHKQSLLMIVP